SFSRDWSSDVCSSDLPTAPGGRARILVVDDARDARESLGLLLELDGHEVAYAGDGAEAIRREEEFVPALVLLDLGLPDIHGADRSEERRGGKDWRCSR